MLTAQQIFTKTMPFVWAKFLLGLATFVLAILLFALLMGIGWLFNSEGVFGIMFFAWLACVGAIQFFLNHSLGYLVKAGHIAVITELVTGGELPEKQLEYGKERVKERFATSNVYFVLDKLVIGAVKQIQRGIERAGNTLDFVPGMKTVTGLLKFFVGIFLGYIDECCLGYTFYKKDQNAFKSAADGVAIYAQNWKLLLKDAAQTMCVVIAALIVATLVAFVIIGVPFRMLGWNGTVAFVLACFLAWAVKTAFIDSYILIRMMTSYMGAAPSTILNFDLYKQLCALSSKFKELLQQAKAEMTAPAGTNDTEPADAFPEEARHTRE